MNGSKKLTITDFGTVLFIAIVSAFIPTTVCGQPADVNVVNTPSVTVTNPVELAPGTIIGISSTNNTVKIAANSPVTVRGEKTEIIYNQVVTAQCCPPAITALVDVSAYKQIRIAVIREPGNNSSVVITPYLRFSNDPNLYYTDRIPLDVNYQNSMNEVYDTPGQFAQVQLQGSGSIRVMIFGRRN